MVFHHDDSSAGLVSRAEARSSVVLICEHASHHIPSDLNNLGLSNAARHSHVAWDPGALAVAEAMSQRLDAVLIAATVSRLVYDCNRPPDAPDAMPAKSEAYDIPGNVGLTEPQMRERVAWYYAPFRDAIAAAISRLKKPVIVTIHSFTPVYHGQKRDVEIGILHDEDSRLADALLVIDQPFKVRRNAPYGPQDGVTHTLKEHAITPGHLNVMIEVRSDLIADGPSQVAMAEVLVDWLSQALHNMGVTACKG